MTSTPLVEWAGVSVAARARALTPLLGVTATVLALGLGVSGCGGARPARFAEPISTAAVPVPAGTRLALDVRRCDPGAHAYCAREAVLVAARRSDATSASTAATALMSAETALLARRHWSASKGEGTAELMAQSPDARLSVTYATAALELKAIALDDITRAPAVVRALHHAQAGHLPALALTVQAGVP